MKQRLSYLLLMFVLAINAFSQHCVYDKNIQTLQVVLNNDPLLPPVLKLNHSSYLTIAWDEMSHDYHRYTYRIQHCTRDWQPSEEIFESDYIRGNNNLVVENYETSFNTTQLYTHYSLRFPNPDVNISISGNYKLLVYDEDDEESPALEVRFMVVEDEMSVSMQVSSNTDIDINNEHQQVSLNLKYGALSVINPYTQVYPVVVQNRRPSRTVAGIKPNINKAGGLEWTHCSELIFPSGTEYNKFEVLDMNEPGMNVDNIKWLDPYYHAVLWANTIPSAYITDEDRNGAFIPRTDDQENNDTQAEYHFVHFALETPRLSKDVYVSGQWSNGELDPSCKMIYNEELRCYEAAILLKQGYYDFQYLIADEDTVDNLANFWQTENEYQVFIYYKEIGGRYDRLVAYQRVNIKF